MTAGTEQALNVNLETNFETPEVDAMKSTACVGMKMVQEHADFSGEFKGLGGKISTDKPETKGES